MASLNWTDGIGAASLSNAFLYPGNRFKNWTPANKPFGEHSTNLGTGQRNVTAFRDDLTVSLEIPGIPNSDQSLMLRLELHLRRGGAVTLVTTPDVTIPIFGTCKLAPGADVSIQLSDKTNLEYTFSTVLRGTASALYPPGVGLGDFYIWFQADAPLAVGLPDDLDPLSSWFDWSTSPGGNNGAAPLLISNPRFDAVVQNGKPGVFFDANNYGDPSYNHVDRFVLPWGALLPAQFTSLEGFLVCKRETIGFESGGPWEMGSGNAGGTQNGHYPKEGGPLDQHVIDTFGSAGQQDAGIPGIDVYQAHLYNPSSVFGGSWQARFNGVLTADNPVSSYGVPDPLIANTAVQIGVTKPGGDNAFHGWKHEVLVCSPKRTDEQRAEFESYVDTKWALGF